jgi:uncharacterized protein
MEVRIADLGSVPRRVEFSEPVEGMNRQLALSPGCTGQHFDEALKVAAELQLCGDDVVVTGRLEGGVTGDCPRCLDEFFRGIKRDFRLVVERIDRGATAESSAVASHDGDRLDLSPLVVEELLLGVDDTTPCSEDCRGLCFGCGANLNRTPCTCD